MASTPAILRYPYEAITETTDYLQITIFQYDTNANKDNNLLAAKNFQNTNPYSSLKIAQNNVLKAKVLTDDGVIALPMPSNIQDSNSVSYEAGEMNNLTAEGLKAYDKLTQKMTGNTFAEKIASAGNNMLTGAQTFINNMDEAGTRNLIMKALGAQAVNIFGANVSLNQLLARTGGQVLNPNMELLLNNATLRTFRFSFKMTPRDDREATSIKSIIRAFKRNMAIREVEGLFIKTPNIFELQYKKGNRPHPFLNLFQPCALTDMSVNYTGENVYATYADGTPVSMVMTLTFKELVPVYQGDYDKKANFDGEKLNENGVPIYEDVQDADLIYGITKGSEPVQNQSKNPPAQNKNIQGVGY